MVNFKICVRKQRKDGFWPVYIRVTHQRKVGYIKTDKLTVSENIGRNGDVEDPIIVQHCSKLMVHYVERMNRVDAESWSIAEVIDYVTREDEDLCFSDYARKHIAKLIDAGQARTAKNYQLACQHLERFAGTTKIMFSQMTTNFVQRWMDTLADTRRAKEMYPVCVRQVFREACRELNDYDTQMIRIKVNPWTKIDIPSADKAEQIAITPKECRAFFSAPLPESMYKAPLPELGRDVAMMVLCLGGINTVDLYEMKKEAYHDGVLHYNRAKTRNSRRDEAYMEMRVPPILASIMNKYMNKTEDPYLFCFHERHSTSDSFCANVNIGIRAICKSMGLEKEDYYHVYTFRHTWGTVAQNFCGASISDVAFGMNHSSGHTITRGYIKLDFTPAWELNEKVIDYIFFSDEEYEPEDKKEEEATPFEKFSPKQMMRGTAYFMGKKLGSVQDIGYHNVDEIIWKLTNFVPDDVPQGCVVLFKIENLDKKQTAIYERTKGKGQLF